MVAEGIQVLKPLRKSAIRSKFGRFGSVMGIRNKLVISKLYSVPGFDKL